MIEGIIFGFAVIAGLGKLFPRLEGYFGFVLFMGSVLIPLILLVGTTFLGIPLFWMGVSIIILSLGNLIKNFFFNTFKLNDNWQYFFFHPGVVLPLLVVMVAMLMDLEPYLIWNWDEFSSWGSWAKQIFIADVSWREDMLGIYPAYPKGWPMTVAFAQIPFIGYDEYRGIALLTLFHIGLLALTFDVTRLIIEEETGATKTISFLLSWTILLILISIEASWKLLPPSLLIERPVLYWSIGLFILSLFIFYLKFNRTTILVSIGLLITSALALKTPGVALTIPAGFIGLIYWKYSHLESKVGVSSISAIKMMLYLFGPVFIVSVLWSLQSYEKGISTSFPRLFDTTSLDKFLFISGLIKTETLSYLSSYKLPLTVVSVFGLFSAVWYQRQRSIVIAVLGFFFITLITLWPLYLFNMGSADIATTLPHLSSLPRYIRLPIRIVHYVGTTLFVINIFIFLNSKNTFWSEILLKENRLKVISSIFIASMGIIQAWNLVNVYLDMGSRVHGSTTTDLTRAAKIKRFRAQAISFNLVINRLNITNPSVLFISQGNVGFAVRMAMYYSINDQRGGKIHNYRLKEGSSWGLIKENIWMHQTTNKEFKRLILESKIIWPHKLDTWSENILRRYVKNIQCRQNLDKYFLIKLKEILQCYSKNQFPHNGKY